MHRPLRKAVFPVAGQGTRFLPATKSVPKEMLPLVDRPLIQYAIDEARAAGITEFIFVTARGKGAIEDYLDRALELEASLRARGKHDLLAELAACTMPAGTAFFVRQDAPLGLGHAVWCARHLIGDEPFAVILPDDVIASETPCLQQMVAAWRRTGGSMVAAMEVPSDKTSSYGILDVPPSVGALAPVRGMVEKPTPGTAPSNLAVIGRYILHPQVLRHLDAVKPGAGGEIQLTDAIAAEIASPRGVWGFRFEGERFDCGSKAGFLQATVAFALARSDLRGEFSRFLAERVSERARAAA